MLGCLECCNHDITEVVWCGEGLTLAPCADAFAQDVRDDRLDQWLLSIESGNRRPGNGLQGPSSIQDD